MQAIERQLSVTLNMQMNSKDEKQIVEILNSIESAEASISTRKTSDIAPQQAQVEILETKDDLKIVESNEDISQVIQEETKIEVEKPKDETSVNETAKKPKEISTEETKLKKPVLEEKSQEAVKDKNDEQKVIESPKEETLKIVESSGTQPVSEEKISEISEIEKCIAKSKDEIEHTIESIKKVRRTTPEIQAIERQLSVTFEHANELPNNEKQITEIINSIESAEASISTRKTSDIAVVKGNFAALKQSLITLRNVIIEQKAKITSIDVQPHKAEIDIIETKDELKIVVEEQKVDESISKQIAKPKDTEKQEIIQPQTAILESVPDFDKQILKAKEEIENVILSIKNVRRSTSELEAAQKQINIVLENITNLTENQQQIQKAIETVESAELSIATRKTGDILLVKNNLSNLKQSINVLNNAVQAQKSEVKDIEKKKQIADLSIIETPEELKIVESNESIATLIEEQKDELKIVESNENLAIKEAKAKEIVSESKDKKLIETPKFDEILVEQPKSEKIVEEPKVQEQVIEKPKIEEKPEKPIEQLIIEEPKVTDFITEEKQSEQLKVDEKPAIETTKIDEILTSEQLKPQEEINVEFCIKKSKSEIESAMASIKSVRRPTTELQATESDLKITLENITNLPDDKAQISKAIESIEKAEASLSIRKTSDVMLVKENLKSLKQSLELLKKTVESQKSQITEISPTKQIADLSIIESSEDLKIVESNEDISSVSEEGKFIKPLDLPSEPKSPTEVCLEKSKSDMEITVESIRKARKSTTELQAVERQISETLEHLSELPNDENKIQKVIESIQNAESSLTAKKTSDIVLVKENLKTLKESLTLLKTTITPQELKITEISQPETKIADLQIIEPKDDELKIIESNESLVSNEQSAEITLNLSKSREEIENVMFAIKKSRHPPSEVSAVEKTLTSTYEQLFELPKDEKPLEKAIESIEIAEISLITRGASELMIIKENLGTLKHSLVKLISHINPDKAKVLMTELQKPQKANIQEEIKIDESNELKITESNEELKIIEQEQPKKEELPMIVTSIQKLESQIESAIDSIKKSHRPTPELQAVEKEFSFTIEHIKELDNDKQQIEKVIEVIENAESSLIAKRTSDIVLIKENLALVKETLNVLKVTAKSKPIEVVEITHDKPQQALSEELNKDDDKKLIIEEIAKKEEEKLPEISLNENVKKIKSEIDITIESIKKVRRPISEIQAVERDLTFTIEQVNNLPNDQIKLAKVIETIETAETALVTKKTSDVMLVKSNLSDLKKSLILMKVEEPKKSEITETKIPSEPQKAEIEEKSVDQKQKEEIKATVQPKDEQKVEEVKDESKIDEKAKEEAKVEEKSNEELQAEQQPKMEKKEEKLPQNLQELKSDIENSIQSIKKTKRPVPEAEAVEKILSVANENVTEFSANEKELQKAIESITSAEAALVAKKTSDFVLIKKNIVALKEKLVTIHNKLMPQQPEIKEQEIIPEKAKIEETIVEKDKVEEQKDEKPKKAPSFDESQKAIEEKPQIELSPDLKILKSEIATSVDIIKKARRPTSEVEAVEKILSFAIENITEFSTNDVKIQNAIESIATAETSLTSRKTSDIMLVKSNFGELKEKLITIYNKLKPPQQVEVKEIEKPKEALVEEKSSEKSEKEIPKVVEEKLSPELTKLKSEISTTIESIKKVRRPTIELESIQNELKIVLENVTFIPENQEKLQKLIVSIENTETSLSAKKTSDINIVKDCLKSLKSSLNVFKVETKESKIEELSEPNEPPKEDEKLSKVEENKESQKIVEESKAVEETESEKIKTKTDEEIKSKEDESKPKVDETAIVIKIRKQIENTSVTIKKVRRPTPELQTADAELTIVLGKLPEFENDIIHVEKIIKIISSAEDSIITKKTTDVTAVKDSFIILKKILVELKDSKKSNEVVEIKEEFKPQEIEKPKEEEKKEPSPEPVVTIKLNDNARKLKSEIENVTETIKKVRRPTPEIQTLEKTLNDSLNVKILVEIPENLTKLNEILKSVETCEESLMTKKTSDITLFKTSLSSMKECVKVLRAPLLPKEEQKIEEKPQEEKKIEESPKTDEKPKEEEKIEEAPKTEEKPKEEEKKEPSPEPVVSIKLNDNARKLKSEIENVTETIKKVRRPTSEIQALEKTLNESLNVKILVEIPENLTKLNEILKSVETCEESLMTKKTSDITLLKTSLSSMKELVKVLRTPLLPKEEQTIEEKPQEEKKIEEAPKTDEKLNKEPQKSEQQESKLIFEEKDLMSQYIAAIKQELEEVLVHLKKARRPSTELQTLHETLIDLKPKVDDLGKDMKYFENVIHIVNKSKTSLLTKRTMELILLREKVTSLENSLNLLKSTIVTEINGELLSTKKTESDDEILKKQKEAKEEIKLQEELKKQEEIRLKEEELRQKEEEFKKREQELKREEENRLKEEEARRKMLEEEILRKAKEKEAEKIKLQNENEPERPPRRRKQVDDSESQSTDSEMPIATERRRRQQQEIEPEPIKPVRRRRTDEIKEDEQSMPRTPESGRRKRMPTFIARLKNRSAAENSILKLTCAVSEPDCQVKWTKDGMILRNGDKYLIENNNEVLSLEIKNANAEDAGEYCCFVSNSCGEIETSAFVTIFGEDIVPNSTVFTKNLKVFLVLSIVERAKLG
ncbi:hypothetical protein PVAND_006169 [Polypedilum vanderplanki]|uniref:Ig-like domain-containing protein n=1 Tax=Polypedilum vanderplanki TaxID=319348 RepID=A0A9J6C2B1_POLVA|nr:hypothetical protein PVAND_006169 [Polypedilum vanderplanki]